MYNFILFFAQVKSTSLNACSLIHAYLSNVPLLFDWSEAKAERRFDPFVRHVFNIFDEIRNAIFGFDDNDARFSLEATVQAPVRSSSDYHVLIVTCPFWSIHSDQSLSPSESMFIQYTYTSTLC